MRQMSWWKLYDYFGFGWFGKASEELTFEPSPEWAETDLYRDELSIPGRGDSRCQNPNCILDESEGQENVNIARTWWEGWKKRKVKSLSCVRLFAIPWTVAYQAPPSIGFSRQEYGVGFHFLLQGNPPNPGIEPGSPALEADALTSEPLAKP